MPYDNGNGLLLKFELILCVVRRHEKNLPIFSVPTQVRDPYVNTHTHRCVHAMALIMQPILPNLKQITDSFSSDPLMSF